MLALLLEKNILKHIAEIFIVREKKIKREIKEFKKKKPARFLTIRTEQAWKRTCGAHEPLWPHGASSCHRPGRNPGSSNSGWVQV